MHQPFEPAGNRPVKTLKLYFLDTGLAAWLAGVRKTDVLELGSMRGAPFEPEWGAKLPNTCATTPCTTTCISGETARAMKLVCSRARPGKGVSHRMQGRTDCGWGLIQADGFLQGIGCFQFRVDLRWTKKLAARTHVEICLNDAHEEVREIAEEAMEELEKQNSET